MLYYIMLYYNIILQVYCQQSPNRIQNPFKKIPNFLLARKLSLKPTTPFLIALLAVDQPVSRFKGCDGDSIKIN